MLKRGDRTIWRVLLLLCWLAGANSAAAQTRELYRKKSEFNLIIVQEDSSGLRSLLFEENGAAQTAIDTNDPLRLVHAYTRASMTGLAVMPTPRRALVVGLGGGVMPTFLRRNFPQAHIDAAELDPEVAVVAQKFFGFKPDDKMKVHIGDGRKFIEQTANRYDIIFLDAYGADSIPYPLATREFLEAVKSKLADGGIVVANLWAWGSNRLYGSMIRTYESVFPEVHIVRAPWSENRIVIALPQKRGLGRQKLIELAGQVEKGLRPRLYLMTMIDMGYEPSSAVAGGKVLLDKDEPKDP